MSEIDVSKCMFFDKSIYAIEGKLNFCMVNHDNCYKFKDCYYKQLQQLKEHCKQIEETNKILYQEKCDLLKEKLRVKRDLKNTEKDRAWIKEKCIDAGKELGKHSFAWDGKEKNLVVQAMQLNEMYEQLKAENEELKKIQLGHSQGENLYNLYQYKKCLDEIEDLCKCAKDSNTGFSTLCDVVMLKIKEVRCNE